MKAVIASLTDVAETLRGEYEERGGKFFLKVEGDYQPLIDANTKLTEFRDNNRTLNTKVTDLEGKLKTFDGVDPVKFKEQTTKIAELEAAGVKGGGDVAALVAKQVKEAVEPLQKIITAREASEAAAKAEVAKKDLESALREAGTKAGIRDEAMRDYVNRGLDVFKHVDGKIVARKGDAPLFSKKSPAEEMGMEEWAGSLETDASHLFKTSRGGGADNGNRGGGTVVKKTIGADPLEFGRNLEGIAKGEVVVNQG